MSAVVEGTGRGGDSAPVPTIADLLLEYRRLTGASYDDMSRSTNGAITHGRLHQLATEPPSSFPRNAATVQALADLLQVPVATIVLAFASSLGLPVAASGSMLSITLPPGTDNLDPGDVEAIRAVVRQLVQARTQEKSGNPTGRVVDLVREVPDLSRVAARHGESEGRRRHEEQDEDADT